MVDFHEGQRYESEEEESDVPIPKRKWGENYMNGFEQTIEEEFGEVCDESVASLSDNDSSKIVSIHGKDNHVQVRETSFGQASPDTTKKLSVKGFSSSSDETSSSSRSKKKNKTKKKKDGLKVKKETALPPLKAPSLSLIHI